MGHRAIDFGSRVIELHQIGVGLLQLRPELEMDLSGFLLESLELLQLFVELCLFHEVEGVLVALLVGQGAVNLVLDYFLVPVDDELLIEGRLKGLGPRELSEGYFEHF